MVAVEKNLQRVETLVVGLSPQVDPVPFEEIEGMERAAHRLGVDQEAGARQGQGGLKWLE